MARHRAATVRERSAFGIETLLLFGGGSYQIQIQASGVAIQPVVDQALSPSNNLALAFSAASSPTNSVLYLATPMPGIFCLAHVIERAPVFSARLRERDEFGGGRIFGPASGIRAAHLASKTIAQFIPVRQSYPATNLEAEVIVNLPTTEFYVNRPTP
jgi:hypothetical protein